MRIHFSNVNFSSQTGPNTFAYRLAQGLASRGHQIVQGTENYDSVLIFIEPSGKIRQGSKIVHRLDGIWFKPDQFLTHNTAIKWAYDNCHHVIWQSNFDRLMTTKYWGQKTGTVVRNGIQLRAYQPFRREGPFDGSHVFVSSANWHPQKRLIENIQLFQKIREKYPEARLVILGNVPLEEMNRVRSISTQNVTFLGSISHENCLRVYATADAMIHLAWLDHCPNVVVEAMSQNCPVICTSDGGTCELVGDAGLVIQEKKPYDFSLTDYDNPPELIFPDSIILPVRKDFRSSVDINPVISEYERILTP